MRHLPFLPLASLVGLCCLATPAGAQDEPRYALVTSFPTPTVSFQWQLSDRFALRFEGSFSSRDETTQSSPTDPSVFPPRPGSISLSSQTTTEFASRSTSIAVAALWTLYRQEQVSVYVSPRAGIAVTSYDIESSSMIVNPPPELPPSVLTSFNRRETFEDTSSNPTAGLAFGAATNVTSRLALFGEAGLHYSRGDSPTMISAVIVPSVSDSRTRRSSINTRAIGGVMLRF